MSIEPKIVRSTHKSRMVEEISGAIFSLYCDGITAPSKSMIADHMVSGYLMPNAPITAKSAMLSSTADDVEKYFKESVKAAANDMDLPFHFVTRRFYLDTAKGEKVDTCSKSQLASWVSVFANGRSSKAAGVRFVEKESQNDALLMISIEKQQTTLVGAIDAFVAKTEAGVQHGALPAGATVARINADLAKNPGSTHKT